MIEGEPVTKRTSVLTFVSSYLPGFRNGGPVRAIANLVDRLGGEFAFRIVTADRDALEVMPFSNIEVDTWNHVGKANVFYASPGRRGIRSIGRILRETPHDILYLNSFFHPVFTLRPYLALRLGLASACPCVIAPRGEFSEGALRLKAWKKWPYMHVVRRTGWLRGVIWQASSEYEAADIRRALGPNAGTINVASDLSPAITEPVGLTLHRLRKRDSPLRVCFLSRITRMKNLDFALRVVGRVSVPVNFDIYGPVADQAYWRRCCQEIAAMPGHISVSYHGEVPHPRVSTVVSEHDLFLLPTLGENYGHVIAEALAAGTPVLISDRTPWRGLVRAGVGWDLPLSAEDAFVRCLEDCARTEPQAYGEWRERVRTYARVALSDEPDIEANRRLFQLAAGSPQRQSETRRAARRGSIAN